MDMSEHRENITEAERGNLLGDRETTRSVGLIRKHKDPKDPDESNMQLKLVQYEPWVPGRSDNLEIPYGLRLISPASKAAPFPTPTRRKIEAARHMRLVQSHLSKGRKRARELTEMDIDPNAQVARLHCADFFDLDYQHH
eukprot:jgi/Tetstr1/459154/TSEL_004601.t1